jgi:hypothetical protein
VSARDDYPDASNWEQMCVEIDLLRTDVAVLLAKLANTENMLRVITASDLSLWKADQ